MTTARFFWEFFSVRLFSIYTICYLGYAMTDLPVGNAQSVPETFERRFAVQRSEMTNMGMDATTK